MFHKNVAPRFLAQRVVEAPAEELLRRERREEGRGVARVDVGHKSSEESDTKELKKSHRLPKAGGGNKSSLVAKVSSRAAAFRGGVLIHEKIHGCPTCRLTQYQATDPIYASCLLMN